MCPTTPKSFSILLKSELGVRTCRLLLNVWCFSLLWSKRFKIRPKAAVALWNGWKLRYWLPWRSTVETLHSSIFALQFLKQRASRLEEASSYVPQQFAALKTWESCVASWVLFVNILEGWVEVACFGGIAQSTYRMHGNDFKLQLLIWWQLQALTARMCYAESAPATTQIVQHVTGNCKSGSGSIWRYRTGWSIGQKSYDPTLSHRIREEVRTSPCVLWGSFWQDGGSCWNGRNSCWRKSAAKRSKSGRKPKGGDLKSWNASESKKKTTKKSRLPCSTHVARAVCDAKRCKHNLN